MLALSFLTLGVAAIALYASSKIKDDVFKTAMAFTSLLFALVTLFCAPWLLKIALVTVPFLLSGWNIWSRENYL